MSADALQLWASRMLLRVRPEGRLSRVLVRHATGGPRAQPVAELDVDDRLRSAEALAAEIRGIAEADAKGFGGMEQRYVAQGFYGSSAEPAPDRCAFRIHNDYEDGADAVFDGSDPSAKTLLKQLMTHNEVLMRTVVAAMPQIIQQHQSLLNSAHDRIAKLEQREATVRDMYEDLSDRRHQREIEVREQDRVEQRDKALLGKVDLLLPVVLSKLQGGAPARLSLSSGAGGKDAWHQMLEGLFEDLTEEQLRQVQTILKPEQVIVFLELYKVSKYGGGAPPPAPSNESNGGMS